MSAADTSRAAAVQTTKAWWRSRMLWLNVLAAALVALEETTGVLQPRLPVNFYAALAVALPVANAVLRVITSKALTR